MRCNYFKLFLLLNKRILKKFSFIVILLLIPLISIGLKMVASNESGIVRIALCNAGNDNKAAKIIDTLMDKNSVFLYSVYEDEESAKKAIMNNVVDAAWVFDENYSELISAYTENMIDGKGASRNAVQILEKEDTVLLRLARMELFGILYSDLSYSLYKNYVNLKLVDGNAKDEELLMYYNHDTVTGSMFKHSFTDSEAKIEPENNYLFTPLRGILILLVMLCGMAAAMYYRDDCDKGIFTWMPVGNEWVFEHVYLLTALIDGAAVVYITFLVLGLIDNPINELLMMIIYIPMCDVFCSILRKLTVNLKSLATSIPIMMILMIVLCPVFIYIRSMRMLQMIFPPFYYLCAKNDSVFLLYGLIYLLVTIAVDVLLHLGSRCSS